jgi:hypothetical protein
MRPAESVERENMRKRLELKLGYSGASVNIPIHFAAQASRTTVTDGAAGPTSLPARA